MKSQNKLLKLHSNNGRGGGRSPGRGQHLLGDHLISSVCLYTPWSVTKKTMQVCTQTSIHHKRADIHIHSLINTEGPKVLFGKFTECIQFVT